MYTIDKPKTALSLKERIAQIAALKEELKTRHYSDGSELIPADVQSKMNRNSGQLPNVPLVAGYTTNDEGILNAYAIEPATYHAEYPSPQQQRRYILLGGAAFLFVALTVWIAFAIS